MTAPTIWLFLHTKRGGVMIESTDEVDAPVRVRKDGRVYRIVRRSRGYWPTATYMQESGK